MIKLKEFFVFLSIVVLTTVISIATIITCSESNALNSVDKEFSSESIAANTSKVSLPVSNNTSSSKNKFTVVVDAGHGSVDSGSIGPSGTLEKDLTLSIALKLGKVLENRGINVVYTRKTDKFAWAGQKEDLLSRAELANSNSADLFVSIHMNSSEYKNARGTETYYHPLSTKGKNLASIVQKEIVSAVKLRDRGIKSEDYSVLRNVSAPSIIIELGYLSNYKEEALLKNSTYHDKFAKAISKGILKYIEK
jgi:N-acetylmuramoyl-L-alanine amidase